MELINHVASYVLFYWVWGLISKFQCIVTAMGHYLVYGTDSHSGTI